MLTDARGALIEPNALVIYGTRRGSTLTLTEARVLFSPAEGITKMLVRRLRDCAWGAPMTDVVPRKVYVDPKRVVVLHPHDTPHDHDRFADEGNPIAD